MLPFVSLAQSPCDSLDLKNNAAIGIGDFITICLSDSFMLDAGVTGVTYLWNTGDTSKTIRIDSSGVYSVEVNATGCSATDSIYVAACSGPGPPPLFNIHKFDGTYFQNGVIATCAEDTLVLNEASLTTSFCGFGGYIKNWSPPLDLTPLPGFPPKSMFLAPTVTTTYTITFGLGICPLELDTIEVEIIILDSPEINLNDTTLCPGEGISLDAGHFLEANYLWSTKDTSRHIIVSSPGTYWVTVSNGCFTTSDTVKVTITDCENNIYIPNVFSPNGDHKNDVFLVQGKGIANFHLLIYNRWGEQVFETKNIHQGWDGTYHGKPMNLGTFTYYLNVKLLDGREIKRKGDVALVR